MNLELREISQTRRLKTHDSTPVRNLKQSDSETETESSVPLPGAAQPAGGGALLLGGRGLCINPRDPRSSAAVTASVTLYPALSIL